VLLGGVAALAAAAWGLFAVRHVAPSRAAKDAAQAVPHALELDGARQAADGVTDRPAA
jgi:hypothetical protein